MIPFRVDYFNLDVHNSLKRVALNHSYVCANTKSLEDIKASLVSIFYKWCFHSQNLKGKQAGSFEGKQTLAWREEKSNFTLFQHIRFWPDDSNI